MLPGDFRCYHSPAAAGSFHLADDVAHQAPFFNNNNNTQLNSNLLPPSNYVQFDHHFNNNQQQPHLSGTCSYHLNHHHQIAIPYPNHQRQQQQQQQTQIIIGPKSVLPPTPAAKNRVSSSTSEKAVVSSTSGSTTHQVRKERSRKAARNRRGRENKEFESLSNLLPFEQGISSQLDKASIIRLVISYLRLRAQTSQIFDKAFVSEQKTPALFGGSSSSSAKCDPQSNDFLYERSHGSRIQEALEGFMLVFEVTRPGRILYVSQTVANFTGLALVDLIGRSIYDYVHPDDGAEIAQRLAASFRSNKLVTSATSDDVPFLFQACFKCTANKRGTFFKVPGYRLFCLVGRLRYGALSDRYLLQQQPVAGKGCLVQSGESCYHFVGVAVALPSVSISEYNLANDQIVFKLDSDLKIIDYDCSAPETEWLANSLTRSTSTIYDICHPQDVGRVQKAHRNFIDKSQAMVPCLRFYFAGASFFGNLWIAAVQVVQQSPKQLQQQANRSVASASASTSSSMLPPGVDVTTIAIFTPISRDDESLANFASEVSARVATTNRRRSLMASLSGDDDDNVSSSSSSSEESGSSSLAKRSRQNDVSLSSPEQSTQVFGSNVGIIYHQQPTSFASNDDDQQHPFSFATHQSQHLDIFAYTDHHHQVHISSYDPSSSSRSPPTTTITTAASRSLVFPPSDVSGAGAVFSALPSYQAMIDIQHPRAQLLPVTSSSVEAFASQSVHYC